MSATVALRIASAADVPALLSMMDDFNRLERIPWQRHQAEPALRHLVGNPELGAAVLIETATEAPAQPATCGYAVMTHGFDLEFGGRDSYLTELYLMPEHRGQGIGSTAVERILELARQLGAHALHLTVYPDNAPAVAAYKRAGFQTSPRLFMTKLLPAGEST